MKRKTAKLFKAGSSQAARLPREFRFDDMDEVYISRKGDNVILSPRPSSWDDFFANDQCATDDFMSKRNDPLL